MATRRTKTKGRIDVIGLIGETGVLVKMAMIKKYTLLSLKNCSSKHFGTKLTLHLKSSSY